MTRHSVSMTMRNATAETGVTDDASNNQKVATRARP
jgi:hypothetical protein